MKPSPKLSPKYIIEILLLAGRAINSIAVTPVTFPAGCFVVFWTVFISFTFWASFYIVIKCSPFKYIFIIGSFFEKKPIAILKADPESLKIINSLQKKFSLHCSMFA